MHFTPPHPLEAKSAPKVGDRDDLVVFKEVEGKGCKVVSLGIVVDLGVVESVLCVEASVGRQVRGVAVAKMPPERHQYN